MQNRYHAAFFYGIRYLGAEDIGFSERYRSSVFHSSGIELGNKELVILFKRVWVVELLLKELKALLGFFKHVFGVQELK